MIPRGAFDDLTWNDSKSLLLTCIIMCYIFYADTVIVTLLILPVVKFIVSFEKINHQE